MDNKQRTPDLSDGFGDAHAKKTTLDFNHSNDKQEHSQGQTQNSEAKEMGNPIEYDRDGFTLLDREYNNDLKAAKDRIATRWEVHYSRMKPMGNERLQAQAQEQIEKDRQAAIDRDFSIAQAKIEQFHFNGLKRDDVYKDLMAREASQVQNISKQEAPLEKEHKLEIRDMISQNYPDSKAETMAELMKEMSAKLDMKKDRSQGRGR